MKESEKNIYKAAGKGAVTGAIEGGIGGALAVGPVGAVVGALGGAAAGSIGGMFHGTNKELRKTFSEAEKKASTKEEREICKRMNNSLRSLDFSMKAYSAADTLKDITKSDDCLIM